MGQMLDFLRSQSHSVHFGSLGQKFTFNVLISDLKSPNFFPFCPDTLDTKED